MHAEINIIPISKRQDTSMSKEVAAAFNAIRNIHGITATLTALGTQVEAAGIDEVLNAVKAAHTAAKAAGADRVISAIRIDERLDKMQTLEDKVQSVKQKLQQ